MPLLSTIGAWIESRSETNRLVIFRSPFGKWLDRVLKGSTACGATLLDLASIWKIRTKAQGELKFMSSSLEAGALRWDCNADKAFGRRRDWQINLHDCAVDGSCNWF